MEGHIIAATLKHFEMESQDAALPVHLSRDLKSSQRQPIFQKAMFDMLKVLIDLPIRPTVRKKTKRASTLDGVLAYARELLTLSLLWAEFEDAIERVMVKESCVVGGSSC